MMNHLDERKKNETMPTKQRILKADAPVDHEYKDVSHLGADVPRHVTKSIESMNFVEKLHVILSDPEYTHIICWMPHGRSWKILNNGLLAREVCPKYFNHSNFASFNRQVNGWGFKRLKREGPDHRSYYDQYFLRGRPGLVHMMSRVTLNSGRRLLNIAKEPNLYSYPSCEMHPVPGGPNPSAEISAVGSGRRGRPMKQNHGPPRKTPTGPSPASQHMSPPAYAPSAFAAASTPNLMMPPQAFAFGPYPNQPSFPSGPPPFNFAPPMAYPPFPPQQFQMMPYWQGCPPPFQYPVMNGVVPHQPHPSVAMHMNYQFPGGPFNHNLPPQFQPNPNVMASMPLKSEEPA